MSPTPLTGADLVLHEVRALRAVVDSLFAQLQPALSRAAPADPRHTELLAALVLVFGAAPFTAAEAVEAARGALTTRHRLQAALRAVGALDAQRLGMTLAALCKRAAGRSAGLQRLGTEGGSRLWSVDLVQPGPS